MGALPVHAVAGGAAADRAGEVAGAGRDKLDGFLGRGRAERGVADEAAGEEFARRPEAPPFRALERAREAAGGKDVTVWGGAQAINQYLAAGLLDELELHIVPILLGDGARLFADLGDADVRLEQVRAVEAPGVTHIKYRVVR